MNSQDKKDIIKYRITKSRNTFKEINILVSNQLWNTSINRLYYACFYAIIALLKAYDIEAITHAGVRQMFGLHFIKSGLIDQDLGRFYTRLFDLRQTGDYDDFLDFDEQKVLALLGPADKLISKIESLLEQSV